MAEWNHRVCERCWFDGTERLERTDGESEWELAELPAPGVLEDGAYRMPVQIKDPEPGPCCFCGGMTITGIFTRKNQDELPCRGRHDVEQWRSWSKVGV